MIVPLARSSSISRSFSFADIERYSVVIEYLFDCLTDFPPSWDDIVFCLETGWKEEDEAVEAREGVWSMTLMLERLGSKCHKSVCSGGSSVPRFQTVSPENKELTTRNAADNGGDLSKWPSRICDAQVCEYVDYGCNGIMISEFFYVLREEPTLMKYSIEGNVSMSTSEPLDVGASTSIIS